MSKALNPYSNFNTFCIRTPLLPVNAFFELVKYNQVSTSEIFTLFENPIFLEAIFIASPELFSQVTKAKITNLEESEISKLSLSLLKYFSRLTSRCTPFGLFAGCTSGGFGFDTSISLSTSQGHQKHTRLDMHHLVNLTNALSEDPTIRNKIKWYPNTSLYKVGEHYRYIEYTYINKTRNYSIEAILASEYIDDLLENSKSGKTITEFAETLVDDDITIEDANEFVEELIDNQVLVSEIEPPVTGESYLPQLITSLKSISAPEHYVDKLVQLEVCLTNIDKTIGNLLSIYQETLNVIDTLGVEYNPKHLFQTDLFLKSNQNELANHVAEDLKKGMSLLNKLTFPKENSTLKKFQDAFSARYEGREVALAHVFDVEMGIGYLQGEQPTGTDPLLDDLILPEKTASQPTNKPWNPVTELLQSKLLKTKKRQILELVDADFKDLKANWEDLPDTMSAMVELINKKGNQQIVVSSFGGSSAANLIGRFSYGDKGLYKLSKEIIAKEKELKSDAIHAEIIHLPESRTGNILQRAVSREYEIPYLGASKVSLVQQLSITDLMLSIRNGELYLRSEKHNKRVIPHLTNAHNYSNNALPMYHFLCDMQTQDKRGSIYFDWGVLAEQNNYLPRVVYKNLIFSKAKWFFKKEVFSDFYKLEDSDKKLSEKVTIWKETHQLPQFVQLVEGDNTLLINLGNITTFQMLLQSIKNKTNIILEEFLFTEDTVVKSETGSFTNQIVVAFYKHNQ